MAFFSFNNLSRKQANNNKNKGSGGNSTPTAEQNPTASQSRRSSEEEPVGVMLNGALKASGLPQPLADISKAAAELAFFSPRLESVLQAIIREMAAGREQLRKERWEKVAC